MKKIIAIVLCIVMVFTMTAGIFAEDSQTINYVSLGSSQTLGYGLPDFYPTQFRNWTGTFLENLAWDFLGWDAPTWNPTAVTKLNNPETGYNNFGLGNDIKGSFGNLLCETLKSRGYTVNYSQLASCAFRAQDLLMFLYDNTSLDCYQNLQFLSDNGFFDLYKGSHDESAIQSVRELYQNAIKDADIITYDLGCGNFSLCLSEIFYSDGISYENNYTSIFTEEEYEQYKKYEDLAKALINRTLQSYGIEATEEFDFIIDAIAYSFTAYCVAFDKTMEWIYSNNPDATVVVMQIQNMIEGYRLNYNGIELPFGDMMQVFVTMANSYASSLSKYSSKILYSKLTDDQRVSFVIDDIANYEGPEDLTDTLKVQLDLYSYIVGFYFKSVLTPVYESLGHYVYDKNYNDVLNASYDACIQFIKYLYLSDYPCELSMDETFGLTSNIIETIMLDAANGVLNGNGNAEAIENAINAFESLSDSEKGCMKFDLYYILCNSALFHPNYEGHQQMADAVINTLDNGEAGSQNRITGFQDAIKEMDNNIQNIGSFVVNKVKEKVNESINNTVSTVKEEINNTVSTIKDNIDKAIISPINSILTKIKDLVK